MKKNIIALMMTIVMVVLTSCGKEIPVTEEIKSTEMNSSVVTTEPDTKTEEVVNNEALTNLDAVEDSTEADLSLKEYKYSFEDKTVADEGKPIFYLADFADDEQYLELNDSVSIYAFNGKCVGYTKEGIRINTIGKYEDWYYLMLDTEYRFMKVSEVDATATDLSSVSSDVGSNTTNNIPAQTNNSVPSNPVESNSSTTAEVPDIPATSDKYTPEEAIAIYRGIMESGGITWDPSLKDVSSWGTGFFYLDKAPLDWADGKSYIEWAGETSLESFAMGDSVGNPWTRYYLEVTSSDDECVYITSWHN